MSFNQEELDYILDHIIIPTIAPDWISVSIAIDINRDNAAWVPDSDQREWLYEVLGAILAEYRVMLEEPEHTPEVIAEIKYRVGLCTHCLRNLMTLS